MINVPNNYQLSTLNQRGTALPIQQTSVSPNQSQNQYTKAVTPAPTIHTSWLYVNDVHGKMTNMERIYNISQEFDRIPAYAYSANFFTPNQNISKFKVASGDIILGANFTNNKVANKFLDWSGFLASTIGNHEIDVAKPDNLAALLDGSKCKMLSLNIDVDKNSPLAGKIQKSMITEMNGVKVGLIGISPSDMLKRVKMNETLSHLKIKDIDTTIELLKQEVQKLKDQDIKIIALLSHSGNKNDKRIAKEVEDLDIIFGAHSHELIRGIKEGENLFYSKSGAPVVITQAGKDGENIGILNVDFNDQGVITRVQNNVINTREFNRPLFIKDSVEQILGKPEVIGRVKSAEKPPVNRLIESNPHANLIVDSMRNELGTEIAILNAGNIRGSFSQGPIDTRLISDITPFEDKMWIVKLTEKQIVDSFKVGLKSMLSSNHKPGILIPSGLKYKADKKGNLLEMTYIDKENKEHKIDVKNPSTTRAYTVACDDFYATGGDGYLESNKNPDFVIQKFNLDKNKLACDYIKKLAQPIEIKNDDRITITS